MSRTSFAEVAERLLATEGREVGVGATELEIAAAARTLDVSIVGGYREFLTRFGWCSFGSFELYGLGAGVPDYLDLVQITRSEREEMEPHLRHDLLPVMNDGAGNLYCLETRAPGEPPVVFWDHEAGPRQIPERSSADFAGWLNDLLSRSAEAEPIEVSPAATELIARLRTEVPGFQGVYEEHVSDNDEVLPHLLFGDLVRLLEQESERGSESSALRTVASILEEAFGRDSYVDELIVVSFIEHLEPQADSTAAVRSHFGPKLERKYRETRERRS